MIKTSVAQLLLGAIAGAAAVWLWGDELRRFADGRTRQARARAADALQSVQDRTGEVLDAAKDQVTSTLQAGQNAIRP